MPAAPEANISQRGEAGRAGSDVRSDLHVSFEQRSSGGIDIQLRSRVDLYYGEVIRQQVRDVLRDLGVEHAHLDIVDEGALPFVIAARIEAAVRRAGPGEGKAALPKRLPCPRRPRGIACDVLDCIFPAMSRNTSSTPACTLPTRSFSTWKTPSTSPKRTRHGCWCATRCAA